MVLLDIKSVTKKFGGLVAIDNFSLQINQGEIIGLIGPNGAGKTTLFNLITGVYSVDSGQIYFDGQKITGYKPHECCRMGIGRTFQIDKVFQQKNVLFNVMAGVLVKEKNMKKAEKRALDILSFIGLIGKMEQLGSNLTIADRKRLEIAKALSTNPKLILLDEVVAGLNPKEVEEAVELIRKIRDMGVTICIVEHIMKVIMNISERVAVLHYGKKLCEGTPQEVSKDKKVIEAYLGEEFLIGEVY